MALTDYVTVSDLEEYLLGTGKNQTVQQGNFATAIAAASRSVDDFCGRRFWLDAAVSERIFTTGYGAEILTPDIATATGLVVATDEDDDGVFEKTWTVGAKTGRGFELYPYNAQTDAELTFPYTRLEANATPFPTWRRAVSITAKWGWPTVPEAVTQAVLIHAARFWKRKDAVLGQGGSSETGFFEMKRLLDPDVRRLLEPYRSFQL